MSSIVIFRSRARSNKCSRRSGGKSDHWILGTHSPKVIRANSLLIADNSVWSSVVRSRSASSKNRRFSASLASRPFSIRSSITRLALQLWRLAILWILRSSSPGSATLRRTGLLVVFEGATNLSYTNLHHVAPLSINSRVPRPRFFDQPHICRRHANVGHPPACCGVHSVGKRADTHCRVSSSLGKISNWRLVPESGRVCRSASFAQSSSLPRRLDSPHG